MDTKLCIYVSIPNLPVSCSVYLVLRMIIMSGVSLNELHA